MEVEGTGLEGALVLTPQCHGDERGFFMESYNRAAFSDATGRDVVFIQDNHSRSARNVLRGLHYQRSPDSQGKLVRVVAGKIYDVIVDLRRHSATLGHWAGFTLSKENRRQMWVPNGFAHGFLVLSDYAEVIYKVDAPYAPESERAIRWDDAQLAIDWPVKLSPIVSAKDGRAGSFAEAELFDE